MDLCHLKNSELEPQFQKYKGRILLRGDIVKDDSGSYAVFTEQGSPATQKTAARIMEIMSRLPRRAGQAADAVPAYTQVKMEDAPTLFKNSKVSLSRYLDSSTKTQIPKSWYLYGRSSRSSWTKSVRSSFGRTITRKAIRESSIKKYGWGKVSKFGIIISLTEKNWPFLSVYVDDFKMAGKTENLGPTWKFLMKDVDLEAPTSFLDHVYLGCTQRECETSKDIVDNYKHMFESRISAGAVEELPETRASGKLDANTISSWCYDIEGHAKTCVERYCELANKTTQQWYKVATPCPRWPPI